MLTERSKRRVNIEEGHGRRKVTKRRQRKNTVDSALKSEIVAFEIKKKRSDLLRVGVASLQCTDEA